MGKPTAEQLIANPSAYGLVRVSGAKLSNKEGNTKVSLTEKFSYFRADTSGSPVATLAKLTETFGASEILEIVNGSSSLKVKQQNAVRPLIEKGTLKRSDEAGMTRKSAEALLGSTSRSYTVTVERKVYVANDGTECDSVEQCVALNKALSEIEQASELDEDEIESEVEA